MLETRKTPGNTKWFVHDRFGMFIHWGLYSMAARHEWVRHNEQIPEDVYDSKYFKRFDPDLYDPVQWAKAAKQAGMKYFVITTKHHEGFCLWDSKCTDYKATRTPAKRDLLRPMIEAFRAEGIRVGLYHLALRKIMQELGRNMQAITGAISQEEWVQVVQLAPKVAAHPEPPLTEKMRILAYLGADATKFTNFDAQTHEAALAMKLAAASSDGKAVIQSFAHVQESCLGCHQAFRKPFVEHFYGAR